MGGDAVAMVVVVMATWHVDAGDEEEGDDDDFYDAVDDDFTVTDHSRRLQRANDTSLNALASLASSAADAAAALNSCESGASDAELDYCKSDSMAAAVMKVR